MLPAKSILFLFDRFEHEGWWVHGLLDGWQLAVLFEVDAAVGAQQDVLPAPVVPVFGVCRGGNTICKEVWRQKKESPITRHGGKSFNDAGMQHLRAVLDGYT